MEPDTRASPSHSYATARDQPERNSIHLTSLPGPYQYDAQALRQRIEQDIERASYACGICLDAIKRESAIWHCCDCYACYHCACVSPWAEADDVHGGTYFPSSGFLIGRVLEMFFGVESVWQLLNGYPRLEMLTLTSEAVWRCPNCRSFQVESPLESCCGCFCPQPIYCS